MKYAAILKHKTKYPIVKMCRFFDVSRSGFYSYVNRAGTKDKDKYLADLIQTCQIRTNSTYGYRRIKLWILRETGEIVNHKAILRIMNKYGLLSQIRRRRKYIQYSQSLHRYDNLLDQNFNADSLNQKWVTDISYIHTDQGVLYLSIIKDLFDNSIVAYKTGTEQTVNLVLDTIRKVKKNEAVTAELQLHSDQGFQYTHQGYFNLTKEYAFNVKAWQLFG